MSPLGGVGEKQSEGRLRLFISAQRYKLIVLPFALSAAGEFYSANRMAN